ncbi:MAG: MipA/OmpV family protein [Pseudomonadota bacterium]
MYVGLGVVSAADYQGAVKRREQALPMIQLEWSNGIFLSGMTAGWHLSERPDVEFGPLLALDSGRDKEGDKPKAGGVKPITGFQTGRVARAGQGLLGMQDIDARLQLGMFANYYLTPSLRLANSVLFGSGRERTGATWNISVQQVATRLSPHHEVALSAGMNVVNRSYNTSYFGITTAEALASGHAVYAPGGGVRDVYVSAGWNWALSPKWMVASGARVTRLSGDARLSPLVERPVNVTVSSGLVYRY